MARSYSTACTTIAAVLLFAACVDLTPRWSERGDAGRASDAAAGGTGGTSDGGGGSGGRAATGGTGGTATGGAAGTIVVDANFVADASDETPETATDGTGGVVATDAAATGDTPGTEPGDTGGVVAVDAGTVADAALPQDVGIDLSVSADTSPPAEAGRSDGAETEESDGSGADGSDGSRVGETGGTSDAGPDAPTAPMIISIDFVGGQPNGASAPSGTVVMDPSESAGARPATHWNSATSSAGTLSSLISAIGSTTSASASWNVSALDGVDTWSVSFTDAPGDTRMMNGYLDPRAINLHATVSVTGLPDLMSSGYDVYVYCYSYMSLPDTLSYQYNIGSTTYSVTQKGPSAKTFPGYVLASGGDAGTAGEGNYVVFRNLTGSSFTLTALPRPSGMGTERAPINGIQVVYPSGF